MGARVGATHQCRTRHPDARAATAAQLAGDKRGRGVVARRQAGGTACVADEVGALAQPCLGIRVFREYDDRTVDRDFAREARVRGDAVDALAGIGADRQATGQDRPAVIAEIRVRLLVDHAEAEADADADVAADRNRSRTARQ